MTRKRAVLAAGLAAATSAFVAAGARADPVEYVRVCDTFGVGYFYIPGTETCLRIGGSLRYDRVENPHDLGVGTLKRFDGIGTRESFFIQMPDYIDRFGGGAYAEYGIGGGKGASGRSYFDFIYGGIDYSGGSASTSGSARIGQDDVVGVGFTFGRPRKKLGTGLIADFTGFGLEGSGKITNEWGVARFGFGRSILLGEDRPRAPVVVLRGGPYFEWIDYESRARADLTFGGSPFTGFFQKYALESRDFYAGATLGADLMFYPCERLQLMFGAYLDLAHHWGDASFRQVTGAGSRRVVDRLDADSSGFVVGGGLRVAAEYAFAENWAVGLSYEYSVLPDATSVDMRESPNAPVLEVSDGDIVRHFVGVRLQRSF